MAPEGGAQKTSAGAPEITRDRRPTDRLGRELVRARARAPRRPPPPEARAAASSEGPGASCPAADHGGEHGLDRLEGKN